MFGSFLANFTFKWAIYVISKVSYFRHMSSHLHQVRILLDIHKWLQLPFSYKSANNLPLCLCRMDGLKERNNFYEHPPFVSLSHGWTESVKRMLNCGFLGCKQNKVEIRIIIDDFEIFKIRLLLFLIGMLNRNYST